MSKWRQLELCQTFEYFIYSFEKYSCFLFFLQCCLSKWIYVYACVKDDDCSLKLLVSIMLVWLTALIWRIPPPFYTWYIFCMTNRKYNRLLLVDLDGSARLKMSYESNTTNIYCQMMLRCFMPSICKYL